MPPLSALKKNQTQLRFSPVAWAKLLFMRDVGPTEVGAFGITLPNDLLYVEDVVVVPQLCTGISTKFDDIGVANFFDEQIDKGRKPAQFGRVWIHTHPNMTANPSSMDEITFRDAFGRADWAVMCIVSRTEDTYCRLKFNVGPGFSSEIPICVDHRGSWHGTDLPGWELEYLCNVTEEPHLLGFETKGFPETMPPGAATTVVQRNISTTVERLKQEWSEAEIAAALKKNSCTLEELAEWLDSDQEADPFAKLQDPRELLLWYGYTDNEIDVRLGEGFTLEELVALEESGNFETATPSGDDEGWFR